jgi:hypothetical protein
MIVQILCIATNVSWIALLFISPLLTSSQIHSTTKYIMYLVGRSSDITIREAGINQNPSGTAIRSVLYTFAVYYIIFHHDEMELSTAISD